VFLSFHHLPSTVNVWLAQDLAMIGDTVPSAQGENEKYAAAPSQSIEDNHAATQDNENSFSSSAGQSRATLDKADEMNAVETSTRYGKFDVLLGRGRSSEKYPGNRFFQGT
jgi:hypothetical protein